MDIGVIFLVYLVRLLLVACWLWPLSPCRRRTPQKSQPISPRKSSASADSAEVTVDSAEAMVASVATVVDSADSAVNS